MEGAAVDVAVSILNAHLDHRSYVVKMEYPYSKLGLFGSKERADIVVLSKRGDGLFPECVVEFKMAQSTNEGVWGDINKLSSIQPPVNRFAILLAKGKPSIVSDFVDNIGEDNKKEHAKRKIVSPRNTNNIQVKVILAKKALESKTSKSPYRAICIELI